MSTGSIVDECDPTMATELLSNIAEEVLEGVPYTIDLDAVKRHIKDLKHRRPETDA